MTTTGSLRSGNVSAALARDRLGVPAVVFFVMSAIDSFFWSASAKYVKWSNHAGWPPVALHTAAAFVRLYRVRLATLIRRSLFWIA